jgi:ADP-ribose pyrophosphatase
VVSDRREQRRVVQRTPRLRAAKWDVVTDLVALADDEQVRRDVVVHPGAVGIVALDDQDRVLLVQQYRHPVGALLWELPAGLLDVAGEDPLAAAARELHEEARVQASSWAVLVDLLTSPGMSGEAIRIYLARDLTAVPEGEHVAQEGEERDMPVAWVPLEAAGRLALSGDLHNGPGVAGILAARVARDEGFANLREASAAWPFRDDSYHASRADTQAEAPVPAGDG